LNLSLPPEVNVATRQHSFANKPLDIVATDEIFQATILNNIMYPLNTLLKAKNTSYNKSSATELSTGFLHRITITLSFGRRYNNSLLLMLCKHQQAFGTVWFSEPCKFQTVGNCRQCFEFPQHLLRRRKLESFDYRLMVKTT